MDGAEEVERAPCSRRSVRQYTLSRCVLPQLTLPLGASRLGRANFTQGSFSVQ